MKPGEHRMSDNYKKAALRLHGLSDKDRQWCMEQLGKEQRARLGALLGELSERGIPPVTLSDDEWRDLPEFRVEDEQVREEEVEPDAEQLIAEANPGVVAEVLRDEPDVFVAALIQASDWPWTSAVLHNLPDRRWERITAHMDTQMSPVSDRVKTMMFERALEKLREAPKRRRSSAGALEDREETARPRQGFLRRMLWQR